MGCFLLPLIIGVVVGIATITELCNIYHTYWNNPAAIAGRYIISPLGSLLADREAKKIVDKYCGSAISSPYSTIACGDFGELVEKYLGKYEAEMQNIMTSAGVAFHDNYWCADFTTFIVRQLGYTVEGFNYSHTRNWIEQFRSGANGWRLLAPGELPQPGDIAMKKDTAHTCMVYEVIDANSFYCFGGNQGGTAGNRMVTKNSYRRISDFYFGRLPGR